MSKISEDETGFVAGAESAEVIDVAEDSAAELLSLLEESSDDEAPLPFCCSTLAPQGLGVGRGSCAEAPDTASRSST